MLKVKNKVFFVKLFVYSFSFFLFVFSILLLKFNQISRDIDLDRINSNSIFYGLPSIELLRDKLKCEIGLSDHTKGIGAAVASIAFGATIIEKHIVLTFILDVD